MYKVTFKPKSPFVTELKSTTIYGAMCCAISQIKDLGSETLENIIFKDQDSLIVSNAFPHDYIPAPSFMDGAGENSYINVNTGEMIEYTPRRFKMDHCMVSRETQNSLAHWQDMYNITNRKFDLYIQSNIFSMTDIKRIIEVVFLNGIGKYRSTGCGQFELLNIEEVTDVLSEQLRDKQTTNLGYMILSDYIPNKTDSTTGKYSARIFKGKTVDGKEKEAVYIVNAGSCFIGKLANNIEAIGKLVKDKNTGTYLCGRALATKISLG